MTIVPGASPPSNGTVSRGIGEATGCNCESMALANTGAVPALRKRLAQTAARIIWRRMISPMKTLDNRRRTHGRAAGCPSPIRHGRIIIAEVRLGATHCRRRWVTNSTIALDCGEEVTIEARRGATG